MKAIALFLLFLLRTLLQVQADDYPGDASTTAFLVVGGIMSGIIETTGDHDWFRTYLIAGRNYSIGMNTDWDTILYLAKASSPGTDVMREDYPPMLYSPTVSEEYFVKCASYGDYHVGSYRVEIADTTSTCSSSNCATCNTQMQGCSDMCNTSKSCVCTGGTYSYGGHCLATCPTGTTGVSGACTPCSSRSNCLSCNSTSCTRCIGTMLLLGSTCVNDCPSTHTAVERSCQPIVCSSTCATCAYSATNCTSCGGSYPYLQGTTCVASCSGSTPYRQGTTCVASCTGSTPYIQSSVCVAACSGGTPYLQGTTCVASCSGGTPYRQGTTCVASCSGSTPYIQSSVCVAACSGGTLYLQNTTCVASCSGTTPYLQNTTCVASCAGITPYLHGTTCVAACPGSAPYIQSSICVSACSGSTPYLQGITCVNSCASSYYLSPITINTCLMCSSPCQSCSESSTKCTACLSSHPYLYRDQCSQSPPSNAATIMVSQVAPAVSTVMIGSSLLNVGGSISILTAVLQKQITYIKYFELPYSASLEDILLASETDLIAFKVIPDLPDSLVDNLTPEPIPEIFSEYDVDASFLVNYWDNLITLAAAAVMCIVLGSVAKCIKPKDGSRKLYSLYSYFQVMFLKFMIVQVYSGFGDLTLFSTLEMRSFTFGHALSYISFVLSVLCMLLGVSVICFHVWFLITYQRLNKTQAQSRARRRIKRFVKAYSNFEILYGDYKTQSFSHQAYLLFFNLRDAASNLIVSTLSDQPLIQTILFVAVSAIFLLYILVKRPFTNLKENVEQIFFEALLFLVYISALIIAIDSKSVGSGDLSATASEAISIILIVYNAVALLISAVNIIIALVCAYKNWKARKRARSPKIKKRPELEKPKRARDVADKPIQSGDDSPDSLSVNSNPSTFTRSGTESRLTLDTTEIHLNPRRNERMRLKQRRDAFDRRKRINRNQQLDELRLPQEPVIEMKKPEVLQRARVTSQFEVPKPLYETNVLSDGTVVRKREFKA